MLMHPSYVMAAPVMRTSNTTPLIKDQVYMKPKIRGGPLYLNRICMEFDMA